MIFNAVPISKISIVVLVNPYVLCRMALCLVPNKITASKKLKARYIKYQNEKLRCSFIVSVSKAFGKAFRTKIKEMELHKRTGCEIDIFAKMLNLMLSGWMDYFEKFNPSSMKDMLLCIERRLVKWAMCIRTSAEEDAGQKNGSAL